MNFKCAMFGKLTTGVGTLRFAAPEQYATGSQKRVYCFKADIYSLGVVLLDMFREYDISLRELSDIHEYVVNQEKVHPSLLDKMPRSVVALIEKMIKKKPDDRPNLMDILNDPLLPQDEVFKKLIPHLHNHKSSVKLDLIRNLC